MGDNIQLYVEPRFAPLPLQGRNVRWRKVAAALSAKPGEWAAVGIQRNAHSAPVRPSTAANLGVECELRNNGDGTSTIWMRWIGWPDQPTRQPAMATFTMPADQPGPTTVGRRIHHWMLGHPVYSSPAVT